jgi:ArsR family transcriptional regulator
MDSAELLDLLGNANRRRILRLLSHKPCYVTEISEYLGVSPKAVIDHLEKLEQAGVVESRTDDQRRKYFYITHSLRLEVNVSPYEFGTKSAYPTSSSFDVTSCRYVSLDATVTEAGTTDGDAPAAATDGTTTDGDEPADDATGEEQAADGDAAVTDPTASRELAKELNHLRDLENELSLAQRWVRGRITEAMDELTAQFEDEDARLYADLLAALAAGAATPVEVSRDVEAPVEVVEDALAVLADNGVVERSGNEWEVAI